MLRRPPAAFFFSFRFLYAFRGHQDDSYSQFGFIQIAGKTRPIPRKPKGKLELCGKLSALVSFSYKKVVLNFFPD